MDNWLKNPWAIRLISLILAILLYTAVSLSQDPNSEDRTFTSSGTDQSERITGVPVEILMDEENYVVSGVPESVVVGVEGPNSSILPIVRQSAIDVFVDLRDYEPGTHEVNLQVDDLPDNVNVYVEPRTIEVTIEERASAEYNVEVDYLNQIAEGYEVQAATATPETVTITSSRSEVERVAAVKAYVDMQDVDSSIDAREVPVNVYDSLGNELNVRVEPETVTVSVEVGNPNKDVPIEANTTGELPEGLVLDSITIEPGEATVFAPTATLNGISELMTEEIDLSEVAESTEMEVSLAQPSGASRVEPQQVMVTIELNQAASSTLEDAEEPSENLPENQTENQTEDLEEPEAEMVNPEAETMEVIVSEPEEEVNQLAPEDIQLPVDQPEAETDEQESEVTTDVEGELVTEPEKEEVTNLIE